MKSNKIPEKLVYSRQRQSCAPYVQGRIPLTWLQRAARLGGNALEAGLVLWYRRGLNKGKSFKIGVGELTLSGKSADTGRRALKALAMAGLIELTRRPGQKALVSVVMEPRNEKEDKAPRASP